MKVLLVWLILSLVWGTTWIFIKIGLRDLPPITFAAARFILAALILGAIIRIWRIKLPNTGAEWKLIALTGFFTFGINYALVFWSEQYITSGLAAVLQTMILIFGLILSNFYLPNEKFTLQKLIAVTLGIIGVGIVFYEQLHVSGFWALAGSLAIVVGAFFAAYANILIKASQIKLNPASLTFSQMLFGIVPLTLYGTSVEGNPLTMNWTTTALLCVLFLAVFGSIIAFWMYYWLLQRIEAVRAMMISLVTPIIAVIIDAIVLRETLPLQTAIGGVFVLASVILIVIKPLGMTEKMRLGRNFTKS